VELEGASQRPLLSLTELPGAYGGLAPHVVANALADVAACRGFGVRAKDIRRALATFSPGESNPGRGNVYLAAGGPVIVDYGHNAAALEATGRMISNVWGGRPAAAVTLPGDRRDDLIISTAEAIAAWFGQVIVYEDADKRGRAPGEMTDIIICAMRRVRPDIACGVTHGPREALRSAVAIADGQPVLFLYEKLAMARYALDAIGARPWPAEAPAGSAGIPARPSATTGATSPSQPPVAAKIAAPPALSELAAEAEQLVPPLTADAERVAPSAAVADSGTSFRVSRRPARRRSAATGG
jgi:cyanophycin synthetase